MQFRNRRFLIMTVILVGLWFFTNIAKAADAPKAVEPSLQTPASGRKLLVISKADHILAYVDPATFKVLAKVPVGEDPHEVVTSTDGKSPMSPTRGVGAFTKSMSSTSLAKKLCRPSTRARCLGRTEWSLSAGGFGLPLKVPNPLAAMIRKRTKSIGSWALVKTARI